MTRRIAILLLVLLPACALGIPSAGAQTVTACQTAIVQRMTQETYVLQSVLYGSVKASSSSSAAKAAPENPDDAWKKYAAKPFGFADKARIGIFETPWTDTAGLISPITETWQAYRCRIRSVCSMMRLSMLLAPATLESTFQSDAADGSPDSTAPEDQKPAEDGSGDSPAADATANAASGITDEDLAGDLLGCDVKEIMPNPAPVDECRLAGIAGYRQVQDLYSFCDLLETSTLDTAQAAIKAGVAYDAGYRSLLQFAGILDWMLRDVPARTILPIRDTVRLLGRLYEIPCFIGQCDVKPGGSAKGSSSSSSSVPYYNGEFSPGQK